MALRALLDLGAKDVAVLRDGREERIAIDRLMVGDRFVVRPGEKVATDGEVRHMTVPLRFEVSREPLRLMLPRPEDRVAVE